MSRTGKQPIDVPDAVEVSFEGSQVKVKGPKGTIEKSIPPFVSLERTGKQIIVSRAGEDRRARSNHGLARTLIANWVQGVVTPFRRSLEISGVGYRAEMLGPQKLKLQCGLSHDVIHLIPDTLVCKLEGQTIVHLEGCDKELVGRVASEIRAHRPCDPYKAKGIKYVGEQIRRKEGKTGAS